MKKLMIVLGVIAALGIFVGALGIGDTIKIMNNDYKDLNKVTKEELEVGDLVKGDIYEAFDEVAVEKTSRSYGFIPMGSSETPYYLVELSDRYAVVSCGNKDVQNKIKSLIDETWKLWDSTDMPTGTVEITAKIIAMPDKVKEFTHDYCKEWGMDEGNYKNIVDVSCVINVVDVDSIKLIPFIGFGVGALALVALIIVIVKTKGRKTPVSPLTPEPPTYNSDTFNMQ